MNSILRVALAVPLDRLFDYRAGDDGDALPGSRVLVPFGRRDTVGIVVERADASELPADRLKSARRVLDTTPLIDAELMTTLRRAARYYQHPLGEVLHTALPAALRSAKPLPAPTASTIALTDEGTRALADPKRRRGTRLAALLDLLAPGPMPMTDIDSLLPGWRVAARSANARGWIARLESAPPAREPVAGPLLNEAQRAATDALIAARGFAPFLLDGVTGSGKTEVYLTAIADCLARGRQALVLLPEIALTPQALRRFRERLGIDIAALHSGLGETERARAWLAAASGEAKVVLGTRSAVFVPLPAAGIIIVDEEHDASYKQQDGFRYHARDLAVLRAQALDVPIVLGSATPSLETLANVAAGRYRALRLPHRTGVSQPPALRVIDLRKQPLKNGLAPATLEAIAATIARDEQVLVFKNRRGYAPVLMCHDCGWSAQCPALRTRADAAPGEPPPALPPLRIQSAGAARVPDLRRPRGASDRPGHRTPRGNAARAFSRCADPARRSRHDARPTRTRRVARSSAERRRAHPRRHADAGQGPRPAAPDAGRRRRCR